LIVDKWAALREWSSYFNYMMHTDYGSNNFLGIMTGCLGGMCKFFLQVQTTPFYTNLIQASVTAVVTASIGWLTVETWKIIKRKLKN
jgi:hypothetical protein